MHAGFRALPVLSFQVIVVVLTVGLLLFFYNGAGLFWSILIEVKLKFTLEQSTKAHTGE